MSHIPLDTTHQGDMERSNDGSRANSMANVSPTLNETDVYIDNLFHKETRL
jgi:hypothetical protein